jgi:hypothetical protein
MNTRSGIASGAHSADCEIVRNREGSYTLKIQGRFPPNWAGNLSSGLSKNRFSIVRGTARKVKTSWTAELEITPDRFAADPKDIDFLALAQNGTGSDTTQQISLDEFSLGDPASNSGALYLEIKALDQTGFLGEFLNRLAFFSLFPEQMEIDTEGERISDRFWIKGVGGSAPSDNAINTLRSKLDSLLKVS